MSSKRQPPEFQFFYIIETAHYFIHDGKQVHRVGYGITIGPKKRICQYAGQSGGEQEFAYLFYGDYGQVDSLENLVKEKLASKTAYIYGEAVEWLSFDSGVTTKSLYDFVLDIIDSEGYDIFPLKNMYLPFNNSPRHKKITNYSVKNNPLKYLDVTNIPNCLKKYNEV